MSSSETPATEAPSAAPTYAMTAQEWAFLDGVVDPHFTSRMGDVCALMEEDLTSAFASVRSELSQEVVKLLELLRIQAVLLRGELLTRMDDKLATVMSSTRAPSRSEPPLLNDVLFLGDSQYLDSFLYLMYDAMAAHSSSFSDDGRRIKWIARHLRPVGSPAADWWLSRVAENASLFDGSVSEGKTAAFSFRLDSLLTVDSFLDDLILNFADPFAAQKALKALQEFAMGKLGVQQFNVKFNSLSY